MSTAYSGSRGHDRARCGSCHAGCGDFRPARREQCRRSGGGLGHPPGRRAVDLGNHRGRSDEASFGSAQVPRPPGSPSPEERVAAPSEPGRPRPAAGCSFLPSRTFARSPGGRSPQAPAQAFVLVDAGGIACAVGPNLPSIRLDDHRVAEPIRASRSASDQSAISGCFQAASRVVSAPDRTRACSGGACGLLS